MRVLILGASGMLGSAVLRMFSSRNVHAVFGTIRNDSLRRHFSEELQKSLISNIDVLNQDALTSVFTNIRPDVVINCVGLIKQLAQVNDPLTALPINSMLPHRLANLAALMGAKLVHISTDCVFSGRKGAYLESDLSDAEDLYGKSKFIGEMHGLSHVVTLRTSIIGHELNSNYALIDWFLSQQGKVRGYTKAIFSGLPTVELARVIHDYVLPKPQLHGLYHVSAKPIAKFDLLQLVAKIYGKDIQIDPDDNLVIDRSLNSHKLTAMTGYVAPDWPALIQLMYQQR